MFGSLRKFGVAIAGVATSIACGAVACLDFDSVSNGPHDSGADGTTHDAAGADVAAGDAITAPRFCATLSPQPTFCEDFDGAKLPGAWDALTLAG